MGIKSFFRDETGAITVDWVVLTAAVVGLAGAIGITIATGSLTVAGKVADDLSTGDALIEHGTAG